MKDLRSGYCNLGPLTLCADLKSPTGVGRPDAYPTGSPGAHFVFHLHNSSHAVFLVAAIEVEVVSWKDANVQVLQHGVGATVVSRRFFVAVSRDRGRYVAQFVGAANRNEYVSVLPNETEPFDVAVAATIPGLYSVRVHAVGSIAGSHIDLPIAAGPSSILFFDRSSPPLVDRGWGGPPMAYFDYIREMSNYDPALGEYGGLDDVV